MLDKYYSLKIKYGDFIIFIKKGNFYYCYKEDAYIVHYFLGYKLINDVVAFSSNALDKVLDILSNKDLGIIIYDRIVLDKIYGDSEKYSNILNDSLEFIGKEKMIETINDKLKSYTFEQLLNLVSTI